MPEPASLADRLAAFIGDGAVALAVCPAPDEIVDEVLPVIRDPVDLYDRHPLWPSFLTDLGLPLELSVKVGGPRQAELRCTIDVTDYQGGLRRNWSRYLAYASAVAGDKGAADSDLWSLCQRALDGVPSTFASRMMHGLGFGPGGWRRGSVYFRTGWLDAAGLIRRFPAEASALAQAYRAYGSPVAGGVEVIGYDFAPGAPLRSKAYAWIAVEEGATFADAVGTHPDLAPAQALFEAHRADGVALPDRSLALQTSVDDDLHQRLVFLSPPWGWAGPDGQERLLQSVARELGIDVSAVSAFRELAASRSFGLSVALIAVGADGGSPSVTFYLWPAPLSKPHVEGGARDRVGEIASAAEVAIGRGTDYLLSLRGEDGWDDYAFEPGVDEEWSERFVTGYVEAMLAADVEQRAELASLDADEAVLARQAPDGRWSEAGWADDLVPTWHALLRLLVSDGDAEPELSASARSHALLFLRSAAVPSDPLPLAAWLGGWIAAGGPPEPRVLRAARSLIELQQPDGRWLAAPNRLVGDGTYIDGGCLVTTASAVGCLRALREAVERPVGAGAGAHGE
jgi:hypothetical protein